MTTPGNPLEAGRNQMELLEFSIDEQRGSGEVYRGLYGINVYKVRHVITFPQVTPVPMQSPFVEGVFHFRGENIPLINLCKYLKLGREPDNADRMVIIAEFNNIQVGFIVHAANNIRRIYWSDIRTPPENQRDTIYKGITGIAMIRENLVRILDVEMIVAQIGLGTSMYNPEKIQSVIGEMREKGLLPRLEAEPPADEDEAATSPARHDAPRPAIAPAGARPALPPAEPSPFGEDDTYAPGKAAPARTAPPASRAGSVGKSGSRIGNNTLLMIVDDSALSRSTMTTLFESAGFSILSLKDGQEAWERLNMFLGEARRQGKKIEELIPLAIIDIEMPRMDGYTLTRMIKEHPEMLGMKVILHTSLGGQENLYKGIKVGADEFLVKFHPSSLLEIIRKYI